MFEKVSGFEIGKYGHQATYWLDFSISKALTFSNMRFDLSNDPRHVPNQYKTWSYDRIGSYEVIKVDPNLWGCPRGPLEGRKSSKMTKIMEVVGPWNMFTCSGKFHFLHFLDFFTCICPKMLRSTSTSATVVDGLTWAVLEKIFFKPEILKTAGRTDNQIEYGDIQNHNLGKKSIFTPYITDISASKNAW